MIENKIWKEVFKQSVPNAKLRIVKWSAIPKMKITMKILQAAIILVTANFTRPYLVHRKILSLPV